MTTKKIKNNKILRVEELSYNSWPSLRTLQYDGWLLRFADSINDRCDCVWPLYASNLDLKDKVKYCESIYSLCNQPPIFRLTSDDNHIDLDNHLEDLNYTIKTPTIVEMINIVQSPMNTKQDEVDIIQCPDESWFKDVACVIGLSKSLITTYKKILQNINLPLGLGKITRNGVTIAIVLGVIEDKFIGLYGFHTLPSYRRQGLAKKLMSALLHWGLRGGAEWAYLHVEEDNTPARTLYESIGFKEIYRYWYRII